MSTTHTPTPWTVNGSFIQSDKKTVANVGDWNTRLDVDEANAAFIVRACNSHAALVAALERLLTAFIEARALAIKEPMACTPLVTSIQCAGGAVAEARAALAAAKE